MEKCSYSTSGFGSSDQPSGGSLQELRNESRHVLSAKYCSPYRVLLKSQLPQALHKPLLTGHQLCPLNSNHALFKTITSPCFCQPQGSSVPQSNSLHPMTRCSHVLRAHLHREVVGAETEMVSPTERRVLRP